MPPHHQRPLDITVPNRQQRRDIDIFPRPSERRRFPSPLRGPSSRGPPPTDRRRRRPEAAPRGPSPTRRPARRTPAKEDEAPLPSYRTHAPAHTRYDPSRTYDFHRRDRATDTHKVTPDPHRVYDFHRRDRATDTHKPTPEPHRTYDFHRGDRATDTHKPTPDPHRVYDFHRRDRSSDTHQPTPAPPRLPIPYTQRPDPRFPPTHHAPPSSQPLTLHDSDGFAAHSLHLLSPPSPTLTTLLATAAARFASHDRIRAEDLVETALRTGVLRHVSDGPRGGIWVVERGREDVVGGVVEMGEGGMGKDGGVEEGVEVGGKGKGEGKEGVGEVVGRAKGTEGEGKGKKRDGVMGLVERIVGRVKKEVQADELLGWVMERVR